MPGLRDFREQFPQYADLGDEDLAAALHERYYSDMDPAEFRRRMELPPLEPPREATAGERLDRALTAPERRLRRGGGELVDTSTDFGAARQAPSDALTIDDTGEPAAEHGFMSNALRLAAERGSSLLGSALKGIVGTPGQALEEAAPMGGIVFGTDWGAEDPADGKFRVRYMNPTEYEALIASRRAIDVAEEGVPDYLKSRDFGGEKRNTPEEIKAAWESGDVSDTLASVFKFGLEAGIESVPDMVATLSGGLGLAAYIGARSSEMGERRAENKGLPDVTLEEQLEALPFAIGSAVLERIGAKGVVGAGQTTAEQIGRATLREGLRRVGSETVRAAGREALTEALQEGMFEYLGETYGTDVELSFRDAVERGFFGALAGGVFGGAGGGAIASVREAPRLVRPGEAIDETTEFESFDVPRDEPAPGPGRPPETTDAPSDTAPESPAEAPGPEASPLSERLADPTTRVRLASVGSEFAALGDPAAEATVERALEGRELGVGDRERLADMLAAIDEVASEEALGAATAELTRARELREASGEPSPAVPIEETGRYFDESEYLPDMDGEARALYELAAAADQAGQADVVDTILAEAETAAEAIQRIEEALPREQEADPASRQAPSVQPPEGTDAGSAGDATGAEPGAGEDVSTALTDPETGVGNAPGWDAAAEAAPAVAALEVDSLPELGNVLGDTARTAVLEAVGQRLRANRLDAYHLGDGRFVIAGDGETELAGELRALQDELAAMVVETATGKLNGIGVTFGAGADTSTAGADLDANGVGRTQRGARARRGEAPPGTTLYSSRPLDMESGTNYVGLIGQQGELPLTPNHEYQLGNGRTVRIPKDPVRRRHIIARLQRAFGNRIYEGRVKGKTRLGFYRPGIGEIRTKHKNDLEVTAHELAHWFDDRYPWIQQLYKAFDDEVRQVSYDVEKVYEGYAEFMRLWLTQEHEARESAPGFYDAWMGALDQHPDMRDVLFDLQELMHAWHLQGARARLASKIGRDKLSIAQRAREVWAAVGSRFLQKVFDGLRPFKQAERDIRGGDMPRRTPSAYESLRLVRGSYGVMRGVFYRGTVNWDADGDLEFTGKGIKDVFAPVEDRMEDMQLYMVARRAQELMKQGRENLIRPDELAAGLAIGDADPEIVEVFEEWLAFNRRMMDFYEASGLLSPESRAVIEELNKNYVPFNRVVDALQGEQTVKRGGSPFIRLRGGTGNINDVFDSIVSNTAHLIHMALVNHAKAQFYNLVDESSGPLHQAPGNQAAARYAVPISSESTPVGIRKDQVVKAVVEGMGLTMSWYRMAKTGVVGSEEELTVVRMLDQMIDGLEPYLTFFQTGQDPRGNVDFYLDGGQKRWYEIGDPALWEAIQQIGPQAHNLAVSILGGFANILRRGVTLTPTFQVKNFIRDTLNAFTLSRGHIVPAAAATKALLERLYNDEHYWLYMINQGGFSSMVEAEGINADRVIDSPNKLLNLYDSGLAAFEYANRIAEFKALVERGYSKRKAAFLGREISTDFAMRGSSAAVRVLTIAKPFLNARMQGLYRLAREFGELPPGRRFKFVGAQAFSYALRSMIAVTIPSLVLYALNRDDERYQEMEEWLKDLHWVLFTGEGEDDYVLIPKPFETGLLWGTVPERVMEYMRTNDERELADAMLWMALETFNLNFLPQAFQPIDELRRNERFTGAPIVPEYMQTVAAPEQYRAYTSDAMIALGRKLGTSPMKAEHLVRGYFGTLGAWGLAGADYLVGDLSQGGEAPARGWQDNLLLAPFVNYGPLRRTKSENDFYDMLMQTREITRTVSLMSERSPERLEAFMAEPERQVLLGLNQALEQIAVELRAINNAMDQIGADPELSGEEKTQQIQALQRAKNELAREARQNINPQIIDELAREVAGQE